MRSDQLKKLYSTTHYWWDGLYSAVWKGMGRVSECEEDRVARQEIDSMLYEVKRKIEAFYGPKIGKAIMYELRTE